MHQIPAWGKIINKNDERGNSLFDTKCVFVERLCALGIVSAADLTVLITTAVSLNSFLLSPVQTKAYPRAAKIPTQGGLYNLRDEFVLFCLFVFRGVEIYVSLMLVSERPSNCWQGLGILLQTRALCTDLPPLEILLNNQSLQITGHPSPANIHYDARKTAFVTLIISARSFFPCSLNVRLWAQLKPTPACFVSLCFPETPGKGQDGQVDTSFSDSSLFTHWGQDLSPDEQRVALKMFQYYGYNGYLSDRLSLERPIADLRPDG